MLIGKAAAEQGFDDVVEQAASHLGRIGGVAAVNRFERVAKEAVKSLGSVGKVAVEKELSNQSVVIRAIESLGLVGEIAVEKRLKNTISQVAFRFISIGSVATEKELDFVARRAAEYLAELAISNKEIAENQIKFIGYAFEEKDQKFFDRFVNLYKQYLEEL